MGILHASSQYDASISPAARYALHQAESAGSRALSGLRLITRTAA